MYRQLAIVALVFVVALPVTANANSAAAQYKQAHADAVAAHEKAGEAGNQWTTTENVLDSAEDAAKSEDYDHAIELAERARALAQLAFEQARNNDDSWRKAMPSD